MKFRLPKQVTTNWLCTNILKEYTSFDTIRIIKEYIHNPISLVDIKLVKTQEGFIQYKTAVPLSFYYNYGRDLIEKSLNTRLYLMDLGRCIKGYNRETKTTISIFKIYRMYFSSDLRRVFI